MSEVPVTQIRLQDTHRLIPSKFSAPRYGETGTVLSRLTDDVATLDALVELDGATNDRLLGEEGLLPGIGVHELVFGVRYAHIVNAAFTHATPDGGRFNSNQRGAWYAGLDRLTSIAEVGYHKQLHLEEIDWPHEEVSTCDDYLADFAMELHDLRGRRAEFKEFLQPAPLPECYQAPQRLAADLLDRQSNGIIYPSARRKGGTCIVCFRPALVYHVRQNARLEFRMKARQKFVPEQVREVSIL
jgi:RES domain-containing protein